MLLDTLAYRTARSHITDFNGESDGLISRHREAMECWECEALIQLGIDAFAWLQRADQQVRSLLASGKMQPDSQLDDAFEHLYTEWLRPAERINTWAATQLERGFEIGNLAEFRRVASEALDIVQNSERMRRIAQKVPSSADLDVIAMPNPHDAWLDAGHSASQ